MALDPLQALQAASRPMARPPALQTLLIAGATGLLGAELVHRLGGGGGYARVGVLAGQPLREGLRGIQPVVVPGDRPPAEWPRLPVDIGIVAFDPPRLHHGRERALWAADPAQLLAIATWLCACGAHTLAVVQPHDAGRLPDALKRGLANLDEHALAGLGFERLLLFRAARKPADVVRGLLPGLAHWMLSSLRFMVPATDRPVRAIKVAELLDEALRIAPPGVHVAAPEVVWAASQQDARTVAARWLLGEAPDGSEAPRPAPDAWKAP